MKKNTVHFTIENNKAFKIKMLNWSSRFNIFCFLDNNNYHFEDPAFECMLAAGCKQSITLNSPDAFEILKDFSDKNPGWLFGHFGYDIAQQKGSEEKDDIGFADGYFFKPEIILRLTKNAVAIETADADPFKIFSTILEQSDVIKKHIPTKVSVKSGIDKNEYIEIIRLLKKHIQRGDCYEINFCQDFYSKNATLDPLFLYYQLSLFSPNPFSVFYKLEDKYCMCASPERFLKKAGETLISQPIKGTGKRDLVNAGIDLQNKNHLKNSAKEKSENVMIVDLVRNDMSKICERGSVFVRELFGIYSFPQVHQMISTVEGIIKKETHWTEIIRSCFPMGSMTGAPKVKVMELIDRYENSPRGLFSGSIGYVTPEVDFDFNVVIRSLFYNESKQFVSFKAGGGITFNSNALEEYEESMLKAEAIIKILGKEG